MKLIQYDNTRVLRNGLIPAAALLTVFFIRSQLVWMGFLIIGQAHFLMSYIYQYRSGKIGQRYLLTGAGIFILPCCYYLFYADPTPLLLITSLMFATHFVLDEIQQRGERFSSLKVPAILFVAHFMLLISLYVFPGVTELKCLCHFTVASAFLLTGIGWFTERKVPSESVIYLLGMMAFLWATVFIFAQDIEMPLGILIIIHSLNWYVLSGQKAKIRKGSNLYWGLSTVSLMLFVGLGFLYFGKGIQWPEYLLRPKFYYISAILHISLTSGIVTRTDK